MSGSLRKNSRPHYTDGTRPLIEAISNLMGQKGNRPRRIPSFVGITFQSDHLVKKWSSIKIKIC